VAELETARAGRSGKTGYVWPEQAKLYRRHNSLVSAKLGPLFAKAVGKKAVHKEREHGRHNASVIDFHSLRTTWITEALSRGLPIETVKRISGHKTVEVVTKHYFHPSKDQVRNALEVALPPVLTNGSSTGQAPATELLDRALAKLGGVTARSFKKRVADAAALIRKAQSNLARTSVA
jgi:hypothetical protein